jgi:hypothetical protein
MTRNPITAGAVMTATRPKVLFVYFTYGQQTLRMVEATADILRACGCQWESFKSRVNMMPLQTVTAIVEAGAGLALLSLPSFTASLLLGTPPESAAAMSLARVGGAAIVALAIVCWLARRDVRSAASQGVVVALLFYNLALQIFGGSPKSRRDSSVLNCRRLRGVLLGC